ncbi:peptidylprolyl isomerase [Helicobacter anatolicus]|uniref:peptidylprolyl isomerase n=1 Tax=Helicobacter anatolicus TaxID=2905874 RepID=UPI001E4FBD9B|nr:peptidylprolyl isomerase [Helicobacter anatolicus]MCE3038365.1 peptidylprolyl isomerase [Helicobacter anatolicus]
MIEWMQRHKKYLVVTIWVSVIALVFAGMVGWNPSDISLSGDNVAKVGKIKISNQEFQFAYEKTFNEYNELLGGNLTPEQAKTFKIDSIALQQLIQKAKLQNFALDIGLRITDNEVRDFILKYEAFQNNGVFDKNLYTEVLKNNRLTTKFFEESIRESLLIQKLLTLFPTSITTLEQKSIGASFALTDTIEYTSFKLQPLKQKITQESIKEYWEKNKEKYINYPQATLLITKIAIAKQEYTDSALQEFYNENKTLYLDSAGQLSSFDVVKKQVIKDYQTQKAKENALRLKSKFKKDDLQDLEISTLQITLDPKFNNQELREQLQTLKQGEVITPILYDEQNYIIGKIKELKPQSIQDFIQAKQQAQKDLENDLQLKELKEFAQKQLQNFKGKKAKINNLASANFANIDEKYFTLIVGNIFNSKKQSDVIMLDDQAFIYKIEKQMLPNETPSNLIPLVQNIKYQYISNALMEYISKKYPTKIYNNQISQ